MRMKKIVPAFLLALLVILPPAARSMSFEDERKLAREVVTSLDAQGLLVEDQEVAGPVRMLSEKLADHVRKPIYAFNVHVINDRTVNAFTIPDGHIFVNVGTLLFARDLDELAAVIGHEMAHAQLRHIPQAYEQQSQITAASILGVVLGALAASKNPQAGAALIFSSLGGGENFKLAYTRRHELDADDFGRKLLQSSGYDETAMDRFLSRLGGITGGKNFPEYLLTHPTSTNRLSGLTPDAKKPRPDGYYWTLQAGVAGVLLPPEEGTQRVQAMPEPYRKLALAMIETNRGRSADALTLLAGVDLPLANTYRGINLALLGRKDEAYPLLKNYGGTARAQMALAEILEGRGEYDQAIRTLLSYQKKDVKVDYRLGILYEKSKRQTLSHVSFARYFFKTGKRPAAVFHIDKALEARQDLEPGMEDELKEMKEFMKKTETK